MLHHNLNPTLHLFNNMTLSLILILLFELYSFVFNYKYQYVIMHAPLSQCFTTAHYAWVSSLELELLKRYRVFTIYTISIIIFPYRPPTQHTSYIPLFQVITICAAYTPGDNCSVGLRLWCNTYCLQPYTALFVFVFIGATLHSSFLKVFFKAKLHPSRRPIPCVPQESTFYF